MGDGDAVRVTLVRHGESEANRQGRWQGQGDSPLSALGRLQAGKVGARLREAAFDRVVASDLQRASDTARATGHRFDRETAFRELDVGRWEGLTRQEVNEAFPEEIERLSRGEDVALGGGETYALFVDRVERALNALCMSMNAGERALVVCHGGVISALVSIALGIRERGRWPISRIHNTSITELHWRPGRMQVSVFNDDLHLDEVPASESDLSVERHEVLIGSESPLEEAALTRLTASAAYHLAAEALEEGLPEGVQAFEALPGEGSGLEQWLRHASANHASQAARCLVHADEVRSWMGDVLALRADAAGPIVPPRPGRWASMRGGDRPVLRRYNAG